MGKPKHNSGNRCEIDEHQHSKKGCTCGGHSGKCVERKWKGPQWLRRMFRGGKLQKV